MVCLAYSLALRVIVLRSLLNRHADVLGMLHEKACLKL